MQIWLNNPDQHTILSLKLNGTKYQVGGGLSSFFIDKDGTHYNCVYVAVTIPDNTYVETSYQVSDIEYISNTYINQDGTDQFMNENDTIEIGLPYDASMPYTMDTDVVTTTNSITATLTLATPLNVRIETGEWNDTYMTWDEVEGAGTYIVKYLTTGDTATVWPGTPGDPYSKGPTFFYNHGEFGQYVVQAIPDDRNLYNLSDWSLPFTYETTLATPTKSDYAYDPHLSWNQVEYAEEYVYRIDDGDEVSLGDLTELYIGDMGLVPGQKIWVQARSTNEYAADSEWGLIYMITEMLPRVELTMNNGTVEWAPVPNATAFIYTLDGVEDEYTTTDCFIAGLPTGTVVSVRATSTIDGYLDGEAMEIIVKANFPTPSFTFDRSTVVWAFDTEAYNNAGGINAAMEIDVNGNVYVTADLMSEAQRYEVSYGDVVRIRVIVYDNETYTSSAWTEYQTCVDTRPQLATPVLSYTDITGLVTTMPAGMNTVSIIYKCGETGYEQGVWFDGEPGSEIMIGSGFTFEEGEDTTVYVKFQDPYGNYQDSEWATYEFTIA